MELPFTGKKDYTRKADLEGLEEKDQEFGFGYVKSVMPIYIQMGMLSRCRNWCSWKLSRPEIYIWKCL